MPTIYGSWAPSSGVNQRMRLSVEYSVSSPGPGDTSVTVSGTVRLHAGYAFYHSGALFNRWGTLIGSTISDQSINVNVPTNGSQDIFTFNRSAAIGTSASSLSFGFSVRGISYVGSSTVANVTGNIPLPARTSSPTPTNVVVSWPNPTTSSNLILSWDGGAIHEIEHRQRTVIGSSSAAWGPWQTYSGVERSSPYTITELGGYYERQFRVRRGTGAAASAWAYSNAIRHFLQPNTPTLTSVTRQSDSRHTVSWSYTDTWNRPVSNFQVWRWLESSPTWVLVATPSRGARSWVDTADRSNDRVIYRVHAVNAWASIPSGTEGVRTTPAAATGVGAVRTGPTSITLTWTNHHNAATGITIQEQTSTDLGVTWSGWSNRPTDLNFTPVAQTRAISGLDAGTWYQFRVVSIASNSAPNPTLYAYSAASAIIRPANPPSAPTILGPSGIASSAEWVAFYWRHNPTDGSDQTAFELNYRLLGAGSWTSVAQTTPSQSHAVSIPTPGVYEWRVRTKGQHATWSPWSDTGAFEVLDPPTVEITSPAPDEAIPSNRATIAITYADATGSIMTRWRAELADEFGELIEQRSGTSAVTEFRFNAELQNLTDYQVTVWVTSGTGLESEPATVVFSTDFLPPVAPDVAVDWLDSEGLARLAVTNHEGDGTATVNAAHNRIERSTDLGATWETLADSMPLDVGFDDTLVPLSTIVWYRVVAVGELGTEAATDLPIEVETRSSRVWLTGEDGATLMVLANPSLDYSDGHERVSEVYYGRAHPTAHYGEGRPVSVGVSGDLLHDMGYGQDVAALLAQDVFYRDPYGRAFWASVTDGFSRGMDSGGHQRQSISFTVEQVHRVEG